MTVSNLSNPRPPVLFRARDLCIRSLTGLLLAAALCAGAAGRAEAQKVLTGTAAVQRAAQLEGEMDALLVESNGHIIRGQIAEAKAKLEAVDDRYNEYRGLGPDPDGLRRFQARLERERRNLAARCGEQGCGPTDAPGDREKTAASSRPGPADSARAARAQSANAGTTAARTQEAPAPKAPTGSTPAETTPVRAAAPAVSVPPEETRPPAAVPLGDLDQNAPTRPGSREARGAGFVDRITGGSLLVRAGTLLAALIGLLALVAALVVARRRRAPAPANAETMPANVVRVGSGFVTLGNSQHIGARAEQQDAFGFCDTEDAQRFPHLGMVGAVADGMGGMALGAQASHTALRIFLQALPQLASTGARAPEVLQRALEMANRGVVELATSAALADRVGTTFAAVSVTSEGVYWVSAGDTRIYLFRDGQLHQLNTDHNYARMLTREVALGRMSADEAATHEDREAITSFLGQAQISEIDQNRRPFPLQSGDSLILCSDGIYGTLGDEEMLRVIAQSPRNISEHLVARVRAMQRPGQDNMTALVLSYVDAASMTDSPQVPRSVAAGPVGAH